MFKKNKVNGSKTVVELSAIEQEVMKEPFVKGKFILDDEDVIMVINPTDTHDGYSMVHKRLVNGQLVEIKRWPIRSYFYGYCTKDVIVEGLNLFKTQGVTGDSMASLYDYKAGEFVVQPQVWDSITEGTKGQYLENYNGFLAGFRVHSDYESDDVYHYDNPVTGEKVVECHSICTDTFYAMLNTDGTIRGNKLFYGSSFSRIREIIDLGGYASVEDFKDNVRKECNDKKKKSKEAYYQLLADRNDGSISPYLDSEVNNILKLGKMPAKQTD